MPVASTAEDAELARALITGNADAFDRFVDLFRNRIFQYSYLMCGQREDAEEVAQDTLLKVFENFDQLREPSRVKAWVFRIARNACLMKRRRSIFAPAEEVPLDELPHSPTTGGRGPDEELLDTEMRRALHIAIGELPPLYRSVVLLRDLEELTTEETADVLDVSTDVVKTRLHRARAALRDLLEPVMQSAVPPPERPRPLNDSVRRQLAAAYESSRTGAQPNRD
jgi:RNA polymerase sigma-70 factor, ECF subfamily